MLPSEIPELPDPNHVPRAAQDFVKRAQRIVDDIQGFGKHWMGLSADSRDTIAESSAILSRHLAFTAKLSSANKHNCNAELQADPTYDPFLCKPDKWECSCGRRWFHVCDEAEGCFYAQAP